MTKIERQSSTRNSQPLDGTRRRLMTAGAAAALVAVAGVAAATPEPQASVIEKLWKRHCALCAESEVLEAAWRAHLDSAGEKQAEAVLSAAWTKLHGIEDRIMLAPVTSTVDLAIKLEVLWAFDGIAGPDNPWSDHFARVRQDAKDLAAIGHSAIA